VGFWGDGGDGGYAGGGEVDGWCLEGLGGLVRNGRLRWGIECGICWACLSLDYRYGKRSGDRFAFGVAEMNACSFFQVSSCARQCLGYKRET